MGGVLFGEDICSCGNATGKPVVFGWASRTGGHAFPFAWEQSKFLLKEVAGKFPSYDQSAEKGWHNSERLFPDKGKQGSHFSLGLTQHDVRTLQRTIPLWLTLSTNLAKSL